MQRTTIDNLDIITAGPEVDNPAELLSSPRLKELLDEFRQSYEVIILDAPPVLAVTDPAIVGTVADGIVVVVHASTLRHHDAAQTRELLNNLGTPVLGMIVNGIGHADSGYGYGYGYGYMATTAPVVLKERTGKALILFLCWPRPNRNPIQTATVIPGQLDCHYAIVLFNRNLR